MTDDIITFADVYTFQGVSYLRLYTGKDQGNPIAILNNIIHIDALDGSENIYAIAHGYSNWKDAIGFGLLMAEEYGYIIDYELLDESLGQVYLDCEEER